MFTGPSVAPTSTTLPPNPAASTQSASTCASLLAWKTDSAPPPVIASTASTAFSFEALTVWVAPLTLDSSSLLSSRSTAMIGWAPEMRANAAMSWPTTPWPNMATDSSGCSSARLTLCSATSPSREKHACSSVTSNSMRCTCFRIPASPSLSTCASRWERCLPVANTLSPTSNPSTPGPTAWTRPAVVYPGGKGQ